MTRVETATLQKIRTLARHTHPGIVGTCHDWTCPVFLEAMAPVIAAFEATIPGAAVPETTPPSVGELGALKASHEAAKELVMPTVKVSREEMKKTYPGKFFGKKEKSKK